MNEQISQGLTEVGTRLEELLPVNFEGGALLPEQYYDLNRKSPHSDGAYRLAFAVLADAVATYLKYKDSKNRKARILFDEVRYWMKSPSRQGIYAYLNLCDTLGIDGRELLHALERRIRPAHEMLHDIQLSQWLGKPQSGLCPSRRPLRTGAARRTLRQSA